MTITRIKGMYKGRSRAVVHNGLVHAVATDTTCSDGIAEQTRKTLATLEQNLIDAGSGISGLIQATVYLADMSMKTGMDAVWCEWVGEQENWPQRACVGTDLAGDTLVEIVVTAAVL